MLVYKKEYIYPDLPNKWGLANIVFAYFIKFIYSEKATKFCEISTVDLFYIVKVKSTVVISQKFVAFSEYTNFKKKFYSPTLFTLSSSFIRQARKRVFQMSYTTAEKLRPHCTWCKIHFTFKCSHIIFLQLHARPCDLTVTFEPLKSFSPSRNPTSNESRVIDI